MPPPAWRLNHFPLPVLPITTTICACVLRKILPGLAASLVSEPTPQQPPIRVGSNGRSPYAACAQSARRSPGTKRPIFKNGSLAGSPGDIAVASTRPWFPRPRPHPLHTRRYLRTTFGPRFRQLTLVKSALRRFLASKEILKQPHSQVRAIFIEPHS